MTSVYHPASIRNSASGGTVSNKPKSHIGSSGGGSGSGMMTSTSSPGGGAMRVSAGHLLRPHVENCGYLLKQGSSTYSTFRKRWFVLTDGKLFYYETRQATFELGLVDLVNVTNVDAGMDASASPVSSPTTNNNSASSSSASSSHSVAVSSAGATGSALSANSGAPSLLGEYLSSTSHENSSSTSNSASNNSSDSFRFRIETPKRIYQLVAASEPEMWQWISSLRLARLVLHEREMMRDSLRQQIEFGRRMRDEHAAAVSLLEAEHAAHTDARHRLVELTERNDQLRDWNDRVTTQLEHTELELARTRQKLRDALVYVRAYEIAQVAGADLVRRLDLREQQVDALRAQIEALASASSTSGTAVAALPEAAVEAAARVNALTSEIEAENDQLAASQTMILSTSDVGLSEASIRDLRDELKRRDELPVQPSSLVAAEAANARDAELAAAALAADTAARRTTEQKRPVWVPTEAVDDCSGCHAHFSLLRWKKRCSGCGGVFCNDCVPNQVTMRFQNDFKSVRVCNDCYKRAMQAHETKRKDRAAASAAATAAAQAVHAGARASD